MKRFFLLLLTLLMIDAQLIVAQDANVEAISTDAGFYNIQKIQDVKITLSEKDWQYQLDSLRYNGGKYLIGTAEINGQTYNNVGVRWLGSRSFNPGSKRNGIQIKLDYINRTQKIDGHGAIKLSAATRDPSMVREVLGLQIARKYMAAPEANYARASINDENYGLFVNVEEVDRVFLKDKFGSNDNPFFEVNRNAGDETPIDCKKSLFGSLEYEENVNCYLNNFNIISEDGWDELIKLSKTLRENPNDISKILDVDQTLWMLAFNNVLVNLNSYSGKYSNNYYLYQKDNGQFSFILGDLNYAFGSFKSTGVGSDKELNELQTLNPLLHIDNPYKPLIVKLLKDDLNKKIYLSHLREIYKKHFFNDGYVKLIKNLQALIRDDFTKDPGQRYTAEDFDNSLTETIGKRSKIPGIQELMSKRAKFFSKNSNVSSVPPTFKAVEALGRNKFSNLAVADFKITATLGRFTNRVKVVYRLGGKGEFLVTDMKDDGKSNDGSPDDNTYGVMIAPKNGETTIEYYLWAEHATMVGFSPSNYMWELHTANLEDLNK